MIELAVKPPTIPIPFHKLLKVVAIVDPDDAQIRQLLDHIAAEHFEVEVATDFDRDVQDPQREVVVVVERLGQERVLRAAVSRSCRAADGG